MKNIFVLLCSLSLLTANAQKIYSSANAHSHNDYEQASPFALAYKNQFGSIEADIWLKDGNIFVAHDAKDIQPSRTLAALYLSPINQILQQQKQIYPHHQKMYLLIDIKTEAIATLDALIQLLQSYPSIIQHKNIIIAISGNRPTPNQYVNYPDYIHFDGRPTEVYSKQSLKKVALISEAFYKFSLWKGEGEIKETEKKKMEDAVNKAHQLKKPFRFWATPDTKETWNTLMDIKADFINTDHIEALADFLKTHIP
ncbi:MAG: phosphatidylinositol-specific phospholipase C/glycerophosphodiester phosphodiesterase family protein [Chitinophagaceae bacterium]